MRWIEHGERSIYQSPWVNLGLVDVEIPDGPRFDHHVVRMPAAAVGTVLRHPDRGILLLWRHRFISDVWSWEVPAGRVDEGETLAEAAYRECVEETGWAPLGLRQMTTYRWAIGISDGQFGLFVSDGASEIGEPTDPYESERLEWVSEERVRKMIENGDIVDGLTLTALLYALSGLPGTK